MKNENQDNPKPDLVDDVLDGGLKEMYNMGIDHAIALAQRERMGQPLGNPLQSNPLQRLVFKLQQLKKP